MSLTMILSPEYRAAATYMRERSMSFLVPGGISLDGTTVSSAVRHQAFRTMDADGSGALSAQELAAFGKNGQAAGAGGSGDAVFAALDRSGDGALTYAELSASRLFDPDSLKVLLSAQEGDLGRWLLGSADTDGDGGLSAGEYDKLAPKVEVRRVVNGALVSMSDELGPRRFAAIDTDRDGRLSAQELSIQMTSGPQPVGRQASGAGAAPGLVQLNDKDADGRLSGDELAAAASGVPLGDHPGELMTLGDTDQDGQLTTEELRAVVSRRPEFYAYGHVSSDKVPSFAETLLARLLGSSSKTLMDNFIAAPGAEVDAQA